MRNVLVTGGAGFIGAHLVRALLDRGDRVRVLDNLVSGRAENLPPECEVVVGDIRDPLIMAQACSGIDVIFHQAALRAVPRSIVDPISTLDVNVMGTVRMLEAARKAGVRRIIAASSSSVYGDAPLPWREDQVPQPRSPYAASKVAAEACCQAYSRAFGLSIISLRYFNVYGPGMDPESEYALVIPKFIDRAFRGLPLPVHGDGHQSRDFTYIDDVVIVNLLSADADVSVATLNVGGGERHTLLELIAHLEEMVGRALERVHLPPRPGDVRHTQADPSLMQAVLGYAPRTTFDVGLLRTAEAMHRAKDVAVAPR